MRWRSYAVDYYGLRHARTVRSDRTGGVLLEHYDLPDGTPWLSTPHWTAARGLKAEDKAAMRAYAASVSRSTRQASPALR